MARILADLRQAVRQSIRDEEVVDSTPDFKNDEIDEAILECLTELSDYRPYVAIEAVPTTSGSKVIDLAGISGLKKVQRLEYKVGKNPRAFRNYKPIDNERGEIDTTLTPTAGATGTLTGTLTFTSGSTSVSGSGTDFDGELAADNMIQKSTGTRWYRIASVTDDTNLVLAEPCSAEDTGADTASKTVYCTEACLVYCEKDHILTEDKSSLPPQMERILIIGGVANLLLNWTNDARGQLSAAIAKFTDTDNSLRDMGGRIQQAIVDLNKGRDYIASKRTEALKAMDSVSGALTVAVSDLTTGRSEIGEKRAEAITATDKIDAEIVQAIADLDAGRTMIDDERTTADAAIDSVNKRMNQAIADLAAARTMVEGIDTARAAGGYGNLAARELQTATEALQQAQGYLSEGSTASRFAQYATGDLQAARGYMDESKAYMALDYHTREHSEFAARQMQLANNHLGQAQAWMNMDAPAGEYANSAARELNTANTSLNQAGGHLREIQSRLNITSAINALRGLADVKMAQYRADIPGLRVIKTSHRYPKG